MRAVSLLNGNVPIYLNNLQKGAVRIYDEDFCGLQSEPGFACPRSSPRPVQVGLIERMIALDINDDTWLDIVAAVNSHSAVIAYLNPGASGGAWTRKIPSCGVNPVSDCTPGVVNLTAGNPDAGFPGDGGKDIILVMRYQVGTSFPGPKSALGWLRKVVGGSNSSFTYYDIQTPLDNPEPRTLLAFDVWNDNRDAISVSSRDGAPLKTWRCSLKTSSVLRLEKLFSMYLSAGQRVSEIVVANITGTAANPASDLVISVSNGGLYVTNKTSQGWTLNTVTSSPARNYENVSAMDYDGDGRVDVVGDIEYDGNPVLDPYPQRANNTIQIWQNKP